MNGFVFLRLKIVDGFCKKFFACAAGALDQDRAIALRYIWKNVEDVMNQVVFADNVTERVFLGQLLFEFFNRGEIPEGLYTPDDLPPFILQYGCANADRDFLSAFL